MVVKLFSVLLVIVAAAFGSHFISKRWPPPDKPVFTLTGPTVEKLQKLNQLVTLKIYVAEVLTGEGNSYRGSWLIKGDALLAIDMSRVAVSSIDEHSRTAAICLPAPNIVSPRVDHERSMTWDVKKTSWTPWTGDPDTMRDEAMKQAQHLVTFAASRDDHIAQARLHAESAIRALYEALDWKVTIVWETNSQPTTPKHP